MTQNENGQGLSNLDLSLHLWPADEVSPSKFGVVYGNIQSAKRNTELLNKCLSHAAKSGTPIGFLPRQLFVDVTDNPILLPSNCIIDGRGVSITSVTDNKPILVSENWIAGSPKGNSVIRNVNIFGTQTGDNQHGLILRDYHSTIDNLNVRKMGGIGILISTKNAQGKQVSGSMVENKVTNCRIADCAGGGLAVGDPANGRATDGIMSNIFVQMPALSPKPAILVGASAGWFFDNIHTYGGKSEYAIIFSNAYNTNIGRIYVETFKKSAVFFHELQQLTFIQSVVARGNLIDSNGCSVVKVTRKRNKSSSEISINQIGFDCGNSLKNEVSLVDIQEDNDLLVTLNGFQVHGTKKHLVHVPDRLSRK